LYASCGEAASRNVDSIYRTLLGQLYSAAYDENEQRTDLLEACNKALIVSVSADPLLSAGFVGTFKKMADWLKVEALIVVDGVDFLAGEDRDRLSRSFFSLFAAFMADPRFLPSLRVLVGSCSPFEFSRRPPGRSLVPTGNGTLHNPPLILDLGSDKVPGHKCDLGHKLLACLGDVTGLSQEEQDLAAKIILEKAEARFTYIDKAIRFMREPLQRPLQRHLELMPEMNAKYDAELLKIGPNYARLLRTALTWALLGKVWPPVVVVMDDFNKIYKPTAPEPWHIQQLAGESDAGFSGPSMLLVEQLRAASRPFPSLRDDLIIVQDYRQVSRYFLDKTTPHTENHNVAEMCGRCQSEITMSKSLSISKKDGHVELAIACLTHLNNRLFQARAGLLADFNMETATIPLAGASENRAGKQANRSTGQHPKWNGTRETMTWATRVTAMTLTLRNISRYVKRRHFTSLTLLTSTMAALRTLSLRGTTKFGTGLITCKKQKACGRPMKEPRAKNKQRFLRSSTS